MRELEDMLTQAAAVSGLGALADGGSPSPASVGPPPFATSSGWAQHVPNAMNRSSATHDEHRQHDLPLRQHTFPGALVHPRSALAQVNYTSSAHVSFPPTRAPTTSAPGLAHSPSDIAAMPSSLTGEGRSATGWGPPLAHFAQAISGDAQADSLPSELPPPWLQPVSSSSLFGINGARDEALLRPVAPATGSFGSSGSFGGSVSDYIVRNKRLPTYVDIDTAPPSPPRHPSPPTYGPGERGGSSSKPGSSCPSNGWTTYDAVGGKESTSVASAEVRATEPSPSSGDALHDLLWPGYPPHLPPPAMLERCVETFFAKASR